MGGRGSFASGRDVKKTYKTVSKIGKAKVLVGIGKEHSLPVESHSANAMYIKLKPDGTFHELRVFDEDKYLKFEIAYHPEPNINYGDCISPMLHIHELKNRNDFSYTSRTTRKLTKKEFDKYKKYFIGVTLW